MSLYLPPEYGAQLDAMLVRATAWRKANPSKEVRIQWNFPKELLVVAPISEAIKKHFVSANAAGLELIAAIQSPTDRDEPTVLMTRVVLEHEDVRIHDLSAFTCPVCHEKLDAATRVNGPDQTRPRPGDFSICTKCGALLTFGATALSVMTDDDFHGLPVKLQIVLRRGQKMIRRRANRPGTGPPGGGGQPPRHF